MKVDGLLRTRDYDRDYRWMLKPAYIDQVTEDKMSFLIQMMQKSELKQYLESESLYNIYYIYDENGSVLVRSGFSGSMDRQGRNIYAVEGFACPAERNPLFWYALPYLVDWLTKMPMLREQWMSGCGSQETADPVRQIEIDGLTDDDVFDGSCEENGVGIEACRMWQRMRDHSARMRRLYTDIHQSAEMYSFIYGTRPKNFYEGTAFRCYTAETLELLEPVRIADEMVVPNPVFGDADCIYKAEIQIEKKNLRYAAYLLARDGFGEAIAETENMTFDKGGIGMAQIERALMAMDDKMHALGYRRGSRR